MSRKKKALSGPTTEQLVDVHRKFHPREDTRREANTKAIEIIPVSDADLKPIGPPKEPSADLKAYIESIVRQRVDEILSANAGEFEPDFRPRRVANASSQTQDMFEREKWSLYFEKYGCRGCGKKAAPHMSTGHCSTCQNRTYSRLTRLRAVYERAHPEAEIDRNIEKLTLRARSAEILLREEREK